MESQNGLEGTLKTIKFQPPCHGQGQLHQNLPQALLGHFCVQVCASLGSELLSKGAFSLSLPDAAAVTGFLNYLKFM